MVCDYMVRTGLTGADSIESVARNLSLSSYYKRANRAQLSRRRLTKCTPGTERPRRRRHSENECRIASGNRVSECESVSWRESYAISESLSPRRPPHSVCLLLFRLFITIVVIIIALIVVLFVAVADVVVVFLFTSTFNLRQSMPKREFGA